MLANPPMAFENQLEIDRIEEIKDVLIVPEHPKKLARVGAILTVMGSLIWVQWPIDPEKFNIAAVVVLIGLLIAWVSMELTAHTSHLLGQTEPYVK